MIGQTNGGTDISRIPFTDNLYKYGLQYRGAASNFSTDFNNITARGIYTLNGTAMSNAPSDYYYWCFLIVFNERPNSETPTARFCNQYIFQPNRGEIFVREMSGSPATWNTWRCFISSTKATAHADFTQSTNWTTSTLYSSGGTTLLTLNITKTVASSKLKVSFFVPVKTSGQTSAVMVYVDNAGAAAYSTRTNSTSNESVVAGGTFLSGISAGAHTITLRVGVQSTSVTATILAYRQAYITVEEV